MVDLFERYLLYNRLFLELNVVVIIIIWLFVVGYSLLYILVLET